MLDLTPIWISLKTAITATVITFLLGIIAARWMLGYRGKAKGLIEGLLTAPLVLPPTVVGFLLLLLFGKNGFLGQFLQLFNFTIIFSWYATVIAATVVAFPLMYKTALGAFKQIDPNLLACARTLGASEWRVFGEIMLPIAKPGLIAGTLLSFARALGEFGATLMLAGSIPGKTQTIPIAIFFAAESGAMDRALALVLIMLAISLGVITAVNYWSEMKESRGSRGSFRGFRGRGGINLLRANILTKSKLPVGHRTRSAPLVLASLQGRLARLPRQTDSSRSGGDLQNRVLLQTPVSRRENPVPPILGGVPWTWSRGNKSSSQRESLNYPLPQAKIELIVDIKKQLSDFCLDVAFTTDQTPLGLLGASGAGKSTIVRCIAGLETPDRGRIVLNGRVLFDSETGIDLPPCDRRVGFLFQNYALFPHLTVAENIAFGMPQAKSSLAIKQEVEKQLIAVDLQGMGDRYPHELSGGQQQRVALARAKAIEPEILLLDEPFSALDTHLRDKLEKLLRKSLIYYQGVTLFITHNLEEAYRVCPNLLIVDEGEAIAHDSKQNIFEHPPNLRVAQLTGCKNFSRAVAVSPQRIKAIDWDCTLDVIEPIPASLSHVGIRAHQLIFPATDDEENTFPCWLTTISETQHRMTLYLKLHQSPKSPEDYHLQAEVFKEKWTKLKDRPFPWKIQLSQLRIMLLK